MFSQDFLLHESIRGDSILDLSFTPHPDIIHQCKTVRGFSDHHVVLVELSRNPSITNKPKNQVYYYNRASSFCEEVNEVSRHYYEVNEQTKVDISSRQSELHSYVIIYPRQ